MIKEWGRKCIEWDISDQLIGCIHFWVKDCSQKTRNIFFLRIIELYKVEFGLNLLKRKKVVISYRATKALNNFFLRKKPYNHWIKNYFQIANNNTFFSVRSAPNFPLGPKGAFPNCCSPPQELERFAGNIFLILQKKRSFLLILK